jgi:hypothetical protein
MNHIVVTLQSIFPEDVIRIITSYLVMKIPKNDRRYTILNRYFQNMSYPYRKQELFSKTDGQFLGYYIRFYNGHVLLMRTVPKTFISYQYQNMTTMKYSYDRCWFNLKYTIENVNNYWERVVDDKFVPNPNSYIQNITI